MYKDVLCVKSADAKNDCDGERHDATQSSVGNKKDQSNTNNFTSWLALS